MLGGPNALLVRPSESTQAVPVHLVPVCRPLPLSTARWIISLGLVQARLARQGAQLALVLHAERSHQPADAPASRISADTEAASDFLRGESVRDPANEPQLPL